MKIKGLITEDFVNYKKASMTIIFPYCTFKCGKDYCQNSSLAKTPIIEISIDDLVNKYINNSGNQKNINKANNLYGI